MGMSPWLPLRGSWRAQHDWEGTSCGIRRNASASRPSQSRRSRRDSSPIGRAEGFDKSQFTELIFSIVQATGKGALTHHQPNVRRWQRLSASSKGCFQRSGQYKESQKVKNLPQQKTGQFWLTCFCLWDYFTSSIQKKPRFASCRIRSSVIFSTILNFAWQYGQDNPLIFW